MVGFIKVQAIYKPDVVLIYNLHMKSEDLGQIAQVLHTIKYVWLVRLLQDVLLVNVVAPLAGNRTREK